MSQYITRLGTPYQPDKHENLDKKLKSPDKIQNKAFIELALKCENFDKNMLRMRKVKK